MDKNKGLVWVSFSRMKIFSTTVPDVPLVSTPCIDTVKKLPIEYQPDQFLLPNVGRKSIPGTMS